MFYFCPPTYFLPTCSQNTNTRTQTQSIGGDHTDRIATLCAEHRALESIACAEHRALEIKIDLPIGFAINIIFSLRASRTESTHTHARNARNRTNFSHCWHMIHVNPLTKQTTTGLDWFEQSQSNYATKHGYSFRKSTSLLDPNITVIYTYIYACPPD